MTEEEQAQYQAEKKLAAEHAAKKDKMLSKQFSSYSSSSARGMKGKARPRGSSGTLKGIKPPPALPSGSGGSDRDSAGSPSMASDDEFGAPPGLEKPQAPPGKGVVVLCKSVVGVPTLTLARALCAPRVGFPLLQGPRCGCGAPAWPHDAAWPPWQSAAIATAAISP